jgi:hypothetical protein
MLRFLSNGVIAAALTCAWIAAIWVGIDVLFADPATLVFEDLAICFGVLAPILCAIGWGLRGLATRFAGGPALRKA